MCVVLLWQANPPEASVFKQLATLPVRADGTVTVTVHQEEVLTLTTLAVGSKGKTEKPPPPTTPFPLPYSQVRCMRPSVGGHPWS